MAGAEIAAPAWPAAGRGETGVGPAELGVGVIWWPAIDVLCDPREGLVDVIEAEPEAFWTRTGPACRSMLPEALAHLPQPKLLHGVGAPLGGSVAAPDWHEALFRADCAAVRPAHVSEHLAFNHFRPAAGRGPVFTNFLLPPLQSGAAAAMAAEAIVRRRAALGGLKLAVEAGVNYLPPAPGEWEDGAFVAAVARLADCGIVLDLHNVLCNARNGRQPVEAFLADLPLERVWELHLGGGDLRDGVWLDSHSGGASEELLALTAALVPRLPALKAIIFEIMPERANDPALRAVSATLGRLKDIWATRSQDLAVPPVPKDSGEPDCTQAAWENLLGAVATGFGAAVVPEKLQAWWAAAEPRWSLYRRLAREGRASAVAACAPNTARCLISCYGAKRARQMLDGFWRAVPASPLAIDEARHFVDYLAVRATMPVPMARAIAADAFGWGDESGLA